MPPGKTQVCRNSGSAPRRPVRWLVPLVLAMLILGLLAWPGLALELGFRMSTLLPYKAFNPDIAARGDHVAAVWSEGYDSDSDTKQYGRVYLKGADETNGWRGRVELFNANQSLWGRDPRLVLDPNVSGKAHVVWAQASGCPSCNWSSIQYTTCTIGSPTTCNSPTTVISGRTDASTPDVAVDSSGGVHVVWREQGASFDVGPIRYCKKGSCTSPSTVASGQHPSLVYANGYLHLVWDTSSDTDSRIKYERDVSPGNSSWDGSSPRDWWTSPPDLVQYHEPSYPTVGASGNAVYVVWAVQKKDEASKFALAFDFSQDTGNSWLPDPYVFRPGYSIPENEAAGFSSTWRSTSIVANDLYSLQPEVAVTGSGSSAFAHLVWHDRNINSGLYRVWYSYLAGYSDTGTWNPPELLVAESTRSVGLPAIAVGATPDKTHLAFVRDANAALFQDYEVWYAGSNLNRDIDPDDKMRLPILFKNLR